RWRRSRGPGTRSWRYPNRSWQFASGRLPSCDSSTTITLWHCDAGSGRRPSHQERPLALQKTLDQGRTYSPDRDRLSIKRLREMTDATAGVHRGARRGGLAARGARTASGPAVFSTLEYDLRETGENEHDRTRFSARRPCCEHRPPHFPGAFDANG